MLPETAPFPADQIVALNRIISGSSAEQRTWLSGFLAGYQAANAPQPAATAPPARRVPLTILFGTESGNTEALADVARKAAGKLGFAARVLDMADATPAQIAGIQNLLVIASTWGEGDPPQRAADASAHIPRPVVAPMQPPTTTSAPRVASPIVPPATDAPSLFPAPAALPAQISAAVRAAPPPTPRPASTPVATAPAVVPPAALPVQRPLAPAPAVIAPREAAVTKEIPLPPQSQAQARPGLVPTAPAASPSPGGTSVTPAPPARSAPVEAPGAGPAATAPSPAVPRPSAAPAMVAPAPRPSPGLSDVRPPVVEAPGGAATPVVPPPAKPAGVDPATGVAAPGKTQP